MLAICRFKSTEGQKTVYVFVPQYEGLVFIP